MRPNTELKYGQTRKQNTSIEKDNAKKAINTMGFSVQEIVDASLYDGSSRVISFFKKENETDASFPRKYNIIKKNPL